MVKGAFALMVLIAIVSISLVAIEPYLPYLGIAICLVLFMAASAFIWKVIVAKRKFW